MRAPDQAGLGVLARAKITQDWSPRPAMLLEAMSLRVVDDPSGSGAGRYSRHLLHAERGAVLGRLEHEHRLWYGMKHRFAFVVTRSGRTDFVFRGASHVQHPGVVQLKQPGEMYRDVRRDGPSSFDVVMLDDVVVDTARDALGACEIAIDEPCLSTKDPRAGALLVLNELIDAPQDALVIETAIAEAAIAFVRIATSRHPRTPRERRAVARAREYLLERFAAEVRLDDLADHVGLDKYHLVRAFRAAVGLPPYEYLTHVRIHRARDLLRDGATAAAAATAVGYCDQSQLHRHFVRIVGTTPGHYARQVRGSSRRGRCA